MNARTQKPEPVTPPVETAPTVATVLTTDWSEAHGPAGRFIEVTTDQIAAAPEGLLVLPTAEQLAQRLPTSGL
jgi:hypothetical protein